MKRNCAVLQSIDFDLLVVGGGIYGATICQLAARQGLKVALVEQADFGGQSSANSLKTIHGGLRYLQDGNLGLVRRMVRERRGWMQYAPHLIRPLPFLLPTDRSLRRHRSLFAVALPLIDMLGRDRNDGLMIEHSLPASQVWSRESVQPYFKNESVTGAANWYDAQIYSADRLLWFVMQEAIAAGAIVANYAQVESLNCRDESVNGARVRDMVTDDVFNISARVVVNATGAGVNNLAGKIDGSGSFTPSLAFNLVVPQFEADFALGIPFSLEAEGYQSAGTLFAIPWQDRTLLGTVHLPAFVGDGGVWPARSLIEVLLYQVNQFCHGANLSFEDVDFIYRGYLPVEGEPAGLNLIRESKIVDHAGEDGRNGLLSIIGVKYTTAFSTAAKCLSLIARKLNLEIDREWPRIHSLPNPPISVVAERVGHLLQPAQIEHLERCYGASVDKLIALIENDPSLAEPVGAILPTCLAQLHFAWQSEMATTVDALGNRLGLDLGGSLLEMHHYSAGERERREALRDAISGFMNDQLGWNNANESRIKSRLK